MKPFLAILAFLLIQAAGPLGLANPPAGPSNPKASAPAEPPPVRPAPQQLPAYPGAERVGMDGNLSTNNVPLNAVVFLTSDGVDKVLEYYRRDIESRGLKAIHNMFKPGTGYVGFFDLVSGTMRLANAVEVEGGKTMIVLSSMDPRPLLGKTEVPLDLPYLPGAVNVVTTESKLGISRQRSVQFEVPGATEKEVRDALVKAGRDLQWNPGPDDVIFGKGALVLKRRHETCVIRINPSQQHAQGQPSWFVTMMVMDEEKKPHEEIP